MNQFSSSMSAGKMIINLVFFVLPVLFVLISAAKGSAISQHEVRGCAGKTVTLACPEQQLKVIHIIGAAIHYTALGNTEIPSDCFSVNTTCLQNYAQSQVFKCEGKISCKLQISRSIRQCKGRLHMASYLSVQYQCVSLNSVTDICSSTTRFSSEGFIASPNFPELSPPVQTKCACRIQSNHFVQIQLVEAILTTNNNTCNERLSFADQEFCPEQDTMYFLYTPAIVYKNTTVVFMRDKQSATSGRFWLHFKAVNAGDDVTIDCNVDRRNDFIGKAMPLYDSTACPETNISISGGANQVIYIYKAEMGFIDQSSATDPCNGGSPQCKIGYNQPAMFLCGAKRSCQISLPQKRTINCRGQTYPVNSIFMQHKLVPANRMLNICEKMSMLLVEGFLTSPGYPATVPREALDCSCTLMSELFITTRLVEAVLEGGPDGCVEKMHVGGSTLCPDRSTSYYLSEQLYSQAITIQFIRRQTSETNGDTGRFWLAFSGWGRTINVTCGPTYQTTTTSPNSHRTAPIRVTDPAIRVTDPAIRVTNPAIRVTDPAIRVSSSGRPASDTTSPRQDATELITQNITSTPATSPMDTTTIQPATTTKKQYGTTSYKPPETTDIRTTEISVTQESLPATMQSLSSSKATSQRQTEASTDSVSTVSSDSNDKSTTSSSSRRTKKAKTDSFTGEAEQSTVAKTQVAQTTQIITSQTEIPTQSTVTLHFTSKQQDTSTSPADSISTELGHTETPGTDPGPTGESNRLSVQTAIIGGVIGGAVLVILLLVALIMLIMAVLKRRHGSYNMKPPILENGLPNKIVG